MFHHRAVPLLFKWKLGQAKELSCKWPARFRGARRKGIRLRSPILQKYSGTSAPNPRIKVVFYANPMRKACYKLRSNYYNFSHVICYHVEPQHN